MAVYSTIILLSVVGNFMVLAAFIRAKCFCRVHSYFIAGLALADFLTGLIAIPLAMYARMVVSPWTCYEKTRDFFFAPAVIFCSVSVYHLVAIAINRFIAVSRPLRYSSIMTPLRCKTAIIVLWIMGIAFGVLPIFGKMEDGADSWVCDTDRYTSSAVLAHRVVTSLIVPTFIMILSFIYIRIFYLAYKYKSETTERSKNASSVRSKRSRYLRSRSSWHVKTTVTSAIILAVFSICWFPHSFEFLFEHLYPNHSSILVYIILTETFGFSNSFANPIIYGFRNRAFRLACRRLIKRWFGKTEIRKPRQKN
ncbi:Histamine H2 receptor [Holothuria leucospilota]|uniref:Histamine H2 receptor n=1 Tax=Holothuria leucospilota TaxID=206669 RepID=A0A9Q1CKE1_HOLLE|nr:Histamine H2 receptor [Holothuria leucospilota]